MARLYDTRTTIFSPEGRLYQVEYASEAITQAGICIGIISEDGILLVAGRSIKDSLLDKSETLEKIYKINEDMICAVAGVTSDANILISEIRKFSEQYKVLYGEKATCETIVRHICDVKQMFTQVGGTRPFGVSALYAGWDKHYGYQLYESNPSGNYSGWLGCCVGGNSSVGISILKQEISGQISLNAAQDISMRCLSMCLDVTNLTSDIIECAIFKHEDKNVIKILTKDEINAIIKRYKENSKST